jgi:hypothetical protein
MLQGAGYSQALHRSLDALLSAQRDASTVRAWLLRVGVLTFDTSMLRLRTHLATPDTHVYRVSATYIECTHDSAPVESCASTWMSDQRPGRLVVQLPMTLQRGLKESPTAQIKAGMLRILVVNSSRRGMLEHESRTRSNECWIAACRATRGTDGAYYRGPCWL